MIAWARGRVSVLRAGIGVAAAVVAFGILVPAVVGAFKPQPFATYQERAATPTEVREALLGDGIMFPDTEGASATLFEGPDGDTLSLTHEEQGVRCLFRMRDSGLDILACAERDWPIVHTVTLDEFGMDDAVKDHAHREGVTELLLMYADGKLDVWPVGPSAPGGP